MGYVVLRGSLDPVLDSGVLASWVPHGISGFVARLQRQPTQQEAMNPGNPAQRSRIVNAKDTETNASLAKRAKIAKQGRGF
jgi:hypothetical protein